MRRPALRQMFIVDLVTIVLSVLLVSLQLGDSSPPREEGLREGEHFKIQIEYESRHASDPDNGCPLDALAGVSPSLGVAYRRNGTVIMPGLNGSSGPEHLEHVSIRTIGSKAWIDVYDPRESWKHIDASILMLVSDRAAATEASLSVRWINSKTGDEYNLYGPNERLNVNMIDRDTQLVDTANAMFELKLADLVENDELARWTSIGARQ